MYKANGKHYSVTVAQGDMLCENYPFTVEGETIPCLLAYLPVLGKQALKLDDDNPRLDHLFLGRKSRPTQEEVEKAMNDPVNGFEIEELDRALSLNGGQQQDAFVWRNKCIDFNRRLCVYRRRARAGDDRFKKVRCLIFPDDTPQDQINLIVGNLHVNKPQAWQSFNRSKKAWEMKVKDGHPDKYLAEYFGWKVDEVAAYIMAYELFSVFIKQVPKSYKVDFNDWSKFHRAAQSRVLRQRFGLQKPVTEKVVEEDGTKKRRRKKSDEITPADTIFNNWSDKDGVNGNLRWYCNLVERGLLSKCVHVEHVVVPLVNKLDYTGLKILNEKGSKEAYEYLRDNQASRSLKATTEKLYNRLEDESRSSKTLKEYANGSLEADQTMAELDRLRLMIQKFHTQVAALKAQPTTPVA
jgi:hypothetical protein